MLHNVRTLIDSCTIIDVAVGIKLSHELLSFVLVMHGVHPAVTYISTYKTAHFFTTNIKDQQ